MEEQLPARFGPFVLLSILGAGGMGRAYLARHRDWPRRLVIKRMHAHLLAEESLLKRFEHEARVATYVRHPNVAELVAMGTVEGEPFFATEHVLGLAVSTLVERVEANVMPQIPLDVALAIAVGIARGVEAVHEAVNADTGAKLDLVHRDIGARNILVSTDGVPKIIDLGLGKSAMADWQTATNLVAGSPDYMPPEQALGKHVDRRADVYAAAVTIWELIAGQKRIREPSIPQRLARAIEAQPEPLLVHRPDASPRLEAILQQAMAPRVDARTPSATLFRTALERELESVGRHADPARWIVNACATAIAKESRAIDEAEEKDPWRGANEGGHTQILVAHQMFRPDSHPRARPVRRGDTELADETSEDVLPRSETTHTAPQDTALVPALASGSGPALSASKVAAAIVPTPQSIKIMLVVVAAVAIFLLGVWWARRTPQVAVEAMAHEPTASPTPSSIFSGLPAPPTTPVAPDSPVLDPVDPIEEVEPSSAPSAPIPASVNAAKKGLVERIRSLRRTKFDGVFQRKLTALSSRVTRARTDEEIADISAQISRLERE